MHEPAAKPSNLQEKQKRRDLVCRKTKAVRLISKSIPSFKTDIRETGAPNNRFYSKDRCHHQAAFNTTVHLARGAGKPAEIQKAECLNFISNGKNQAYREFQIQKGMKRFDSVDEFSLREAGTGLLWAESACDLFPQQSSLGPQRAASGSPRCWRRTSMSNIART